LINKQNLRKKKRLIDHKQIHELLEHDHNMIVEEMKKSTRPKSIKNKLRLQESCNNLASSTYMMNYIEKNNASKNRFRKPKNQLMIDIICNNLFNKTYKQYDKGSQDIGINNEDVGILYSSDSDDTNNSDESYDPLETSTLLLKKNILRKNKKKFDKHNNKIHMKPKNQIQKRMNRELNEIYLSRNINDKSKLEYCCNTTKDNNVMDPFKNDNDYKLIRDIKNHVINGRDISYHDNYLVIMKNIDDDILGMNLQDNYINTEKVCITNSVHSVVIFIKRTSCCQIYACKGLQSSPHFSVDHVQKDLLMNILTKNNINCVHLEHNTDDINNNVSLRELNKSRNQDIYSMLYTTMRNICNKGLLRHFFNEKSKNHNDLEQEMSLT